ncbi:TPA: AsnC family transcriptional regulator [Candidatus Micrarchaeota archaeon]|nr:AsnC family transcriptional regulator [Candidatus Micrarchaeota archaeon]
MAIKLDVTDKRILYELEQNCRRSLNEIAKRVRASKQTLHYRIERLVREGTITQFIAILNVAKLGLVNHEVWIQLGDLPEPKKKAFIEFLVSHKNTRWVASCGGKIDVAIAITAENIVQFDSIWQDILDKYPNHVKNYFVNVTPEYFTYPRTHLIGENENRHFSHLGGEPKRLQLDETEMRILDILSKYARMPLTEIAKKVGVTENTIRTKIKRLENDEVIQTYAAIIQPTTLGLVHFEILATTQNMTKEQEKALETYCLLNPYVTYYLRMIGKFDIDIAFDANNNEQFQNTIIEFRSRFSGIIKEFEFVYILKHEKFDYFAGMKK